MDRIFLSPPDVGPLEREALLRAFDSGWVAPVGPELDGFEEEVAAMLGGDVHCVALSSGTAALHLALQLAGVTNGDQVFTSSFTFVASANAIRYCGAEPVFIDCDRTSWNMDPDLLELALEEASKQGRLPKAVVAVDLYGQCADYSRISPLCQRYGLPLIQDSAEALGAFHQGEPAGRQGDFAVFSFNGNKILTTSGGAILVCPNQESATRARFLSTQAREPAPHYQHVELGYNYRMSNLLAALGRAQLQSLPTKVEARKENFRHYQNLLRDEPAIEWIPFGATGTPNYWLSCLTLNPTQTKATPATLIKALASQNIESRPVWKPMHLQPLYQSNKIHGGTISQSLFKQGLCLPSGSTLQPPQLKKITETIKQSL